jgi:hypothetical protein
VLRGVELVVDVDVVMLEVSGAVVTVVVRLAVVEVVVELVVAEDMVVELVVVTVVAAAVYSRTLLFMVSDTQRFPWESNARPSGASRLLAVTVPTADMKSCWPITRDADSPVEKGGVNSKTLSFPISTTHRSPEESKAIPCEL